MYNLYSKYCDTFIQTVIRTMIFAWWRHQMETFSALLDIYAGNSAVPGDFPTQRPVARSFDAFFDLRLNKRLSKQSWGWWIETLLRPLWRHCDGASRSHWVVGTYLIAFHKHLVSSIKYEETVFLWTASTLHRHCTHLLRVSLVNYFRIRCGLYWPLIHWSSAPYVILLNHSVSELGVFLPMTHACC